MNINIEGLLIELRKIAFQRLVNRDQYDIGQKEVNNEINEILHEYEYGLKKETP